MPPPPFVCGDRVHVHFSDDQCWYKGVVSDMVKEPGEDEISYSITYDDGSSESGVKAQDMRMQGRPGNRVLATLDAALRKGGAQLGKKKRDTMLRDAANAGDARAVLQLLQMSASATFVDPQGYTPLHWAAGPEDNMAGDTQERRSCLEMLCRLADVDAPDHTELRMRAVHHAAAHNLVGCVLTLARLGADLSGVTCWAVNCRAHGVLRAMLKMQREDRNGVGGPGAIGGGALSSARPEEDAAHWVGRAGMWEGCTPLMLAASHGDAHAAKLVLDHLRGLGQGVLRKALDARQCGGNRLSALHFAASAASEDVAHLLLQDGATRRRPAPAAPPPSPRRPRRPHTLPLAPPPTGARIEVLSADGATPLQLARRRLTASGGADDSMACCSSSPPPKPPPTPRARRRSRAQREAPPPAFAFPATAGDADVPYDAKRHSNGNGSSGGGDGGGDGGGGGASPSPLRPAPLDAPDRGGSLLPPAFEDGDGILGGAPLGALPSARRARAARRRGGSSGVKLEHIAPGLVRA